MSTTVRITRNFEREVKRLLKKYPSLFNDLRQLQQKLIKNPNEGTPIGFGAYKIRLKIMSKGKGKSGGARVITYVVVETKDNTVVYLLSIYDKSEIESISYTELKELLSRFDK